MAFHARVDTSWVNSVRACDSASSRTWSASLRATHTNNVYTTTHHSAVRPSGMAKVRRDHSLLVMAGPLAVVEVMGVHRERGPKMDCKRGLPQA